MFPISLFLLRNIPVLPVFPAEEPHTADRVAASQMRSAAVLTTTASRRAQSNAGTTRGLCTRGQQSFSWLLPPSTAFPPAACRAEGAARKSTRQSGDRTNQLPVWTLSLRPGHRPSRIPVHFIPAFPYSSDINNFIPMHGNSWAVSCCCTAFCCIWSELDSHPPEDTRTSTCNVTTFGTRVFVCTIELRQDDSRPGV